MAETTWAFSDFEAQFQAAQTLLASRLDAAKANTSVDVLSALSLDLAKLAKLLADATGSLPNYTQRQYELQVKTLEKSLEDLRGSLPKSKFAFRRKTPVAATSVAQPRPTAPAVVAPAPASSTNLILSSHSRRYLTHSALPSSNTSDLTISDLNQCIVNLLPGTSTLKISALHIRNLVDTVLLLPTIPGSVLLHDLRRCVVVVGCHQFRMHTSTLVDVYLSISSNPIIEHCSQLRFATVWSPESPGSLTVQDFSHIKPTPSPNWKKLEENAKVPEWPIEVLETERDVVEKLEELLPS
ncbi:tubulin binding cofactor C-domain-containing protein [Mycena amicta]|nr:tubulin binding cofactor C-domain-containing protein [Mycena amicta]